MLKAKAVIFAAALAGVLVAPSTAISQPAPTPDACSQKEISGRGKPLGFASKVSVKTVFSIGAATLLSLGGPEADWPEGDFRLPPLCEIDRFLVGQDTYVLKRNSGDGPMIWAQSDTRKTVVFLALAPDLPSAYTWYKAGKWESMSPKSATYFLTVMEEGDPELSVTRIYKSLPPLGALKADIAASLQQKLRTIVVYHRARQMTSVRLPSKAVEGDRFWR